MKRALISQMTNEWKTNIWLIIELAIVAIAIWAILFSLWTECKGIFTPRGFNPNDVYSIDVREIPETSPYYLNEYKYNSYEDRNELVRRLMENPNVEYVAVHNNFMPYMLNFIGNRLSIEGLPDKIKYSGNFRTAQPDIIKIMGIQSTTGKSADELSAMLERGEILISANKQYEKKAGPMKNLIGKKAYIDGKEDFPVKIGDIVQKVKRTDYETDERGMVILNFDPNEEPWGNIAIKVKPGKDKEFEKDFYNDPALSRLRNVYLTNLKSLISMGESIHKKTVVNIRVMFSVSLFLLITIFLGLLGSFWFKVQQRISEIAIRKTFGATDYELFQRIIGEGLLLLLAGLIIASACIWPFVNKISNALHYDEKWWTILAIEGITAAVMVVGIVVSLWYPAWKAMHIEPAIAVKAE